MYPKVLKTATTITQITHLLLRSKEISTSGRCQSTRKIVDIKQARNTLPGGANFVNLTLYAFYLNMGSLFIPQLFVNQPPPP